MRRELRITALYLYSPRFRDYKVQCTRARTGPNKVILLMKRGILAVYLYIRYTHFLLDRFYKFYLGSTLYLLHFLRNLKIKINKTVGTYSFVVVC